jgi:hypothetical protein
LGIYIEEASFYGLTIWKSTLERHPTRQGWKGYRDQTMRWERYRHSLESDDSSMTLLCLDLTYNYWCNSYEARHKVYMPYEARRQLTSVSPLQTLG